MITLLNGEQWDKAALLEKMVDDDFYYGHLGKNALSSSAIKLLEKSPKSYNNIVRNGKEQNSTALQIGTFLHTMILEPHLFDERFEIINVQSRVAKAFKEGNAKSKKIVLTAKEHDENNGKAHNNTSAVNFFQLLKQDFSNQSQRYRHKYK